MPSDFSFPYLLDPVGAGERPIRPARGEWNQTTAVCVLLMGGTAAAPCALPARSARILGGQAPAQ